MALQDSLSTASITLTRAQSTLDYIFDALVGPQVTGNGADKPYSSSINGNAQNLADRLEQIESQLNGLRDALVTPTPVASKIEAGAFARTGASITSAKPRSGAGQAMNATTRPTPP